MFPGVPAGDCVTGMIRHVLLERASGLLCHFGHADVTGKIGITLLEKVTGVSYFHGIVDVIGALIN